MVLGRRCADEIETVGREIARQRMLQALLEDRFKLVVHTETKELPVYSLTLAKNGSKLHEAKPGDTYDKAYKLAERRSGWSRSSFGRSRGDNRSGGDDEGHFAVVVAAGRPNRHRQDRTERVSMISR